MGDVKSKLVQNSFIEGSTSAVHPCQRFLLAREPCGSLQNQARERLGSTQAVTEQAGASSCLGNVLSLPCAPGPQARAPHLSSKGPSKARESAAGVSAGFTMSGNPLTSQLNGPPLLRSPHLGDPGVQMLFSNAYLMTTSATEGLISLVSSVPPKVLTTHCSH